MRGVEIQQESMFSYISPEQRVPKNRPLRPMKEMVDAVLSDLSGAFEPMYARTGWFVGLQMDDPIWDPTVFTKNRRGPRIGRNRRLHASRWRSIRHLSTEISRMNNQCIHDC